MFPISIFVAAYITVLLLLGYRYIIYPAFISPLARIPNAHWSASVSPLWILLTRYHWRENREVHAAHLKHGPVVRLGPTEISVNDVGGLRTIYAGGFEKGQWYSIFDNYGYVCLHLAVIIASMLMIATEYRACSPPGTLALTPSESVLYPMSIPSPVSRALPLCTDILRSSCMAVSFPS